MQQSDCLFFFPFSFVPPLHEPVHLHPFHHTIHWLPKIIVNSLLVLLVNDLSPFPSGPPLPMLLLLHRNQKNRTQLLAMVPHGLILHFDHNHYYYYYYYSTTHNYIVTVLKCSLPQPQPPPRCTTTCENREKMTKMIECSF